MAYTANRLSDQNLVIQDGTDYIITGANVNYDPKSLVITAAYAEEINKKITAFDVALTKAQIKAGYKGKVQIIEIPDSSNTMDDYKILRINLNGSAMEDKWSALAYTKEGIFEITGPSLREIRKFFKENGVAEDATVGTYVDIHFISDFPLAEKMNKKEVYVLTRDVDGYSAGTVLALNAKNEVGYYDTTDGSVSLESGMDVVKVAKLPAISNVDQYNANTFYIDLSDSNKVYRFNNNTNEFTESTMTFSEVDELPPEINTDEFTADYYVDTNNSNKVYTFNTDQFEESTYTFSQVNALPGEDNTDTFTADYYVNTADSNKVYTFTSDAFAEASGMSFTTVAELPEESNVSEFTTDYFVDITDGNKVYTFSGTGFDDTTMTMSAVDSLPEESNKDDYSSDTYYVDTTDSNKVYEYTDYEFTESSYTLEETDTVPSVGNVESLDKDYYVNTVSGGAVFTYNADSNTFERQENITSVDVYTDEDLDNVENKLYRIQGTITGKAVGSCWIYNGADYTEVQTQYMFEDPSTGTNPQQNVIYKVSTDSNYYVFNGSIVVEVSVSELAGIPIISDGPDSTVLYKLNSANTYHLWNGASYDEKTATEYSGLPEVITTNPEENKIYKLTSDSMYYIYTGTEFDLVDVVEVSGLPEVIDEDPSTTTLYKVISSNMYYTYDGADFVEVEVEEVAGLPEVVTENPDVHTLFKLNDEYYTYTGTGYAKQTAVVEFNGLPEIITEDPDPNVAYELTAQDGDKAAGTIWIFNAETREYEELTSEDDEEVVKE